MSIVGVLGVVDFANGKVDRNQSRLVSGGKQSRIAPILILVGILEPLKPGFESSEPLGGETFCCPEDGRENRAVEGHDAELRLHPVFAGTLYLPPRHEGIGEPTAIE